MQYFVEFTDTFGGEANYSWVRRADIEVRDGASASLVMRRAKQAIGLSGVRGRRETWGETEVFRPSRSCTVMFVTPKG